MATNAISKVETREPLILSRIYKSDNQKDGTLRAELKQTRTTISKYPTKTVDSNMQDSIFGTQEYGFKEKEYENKTTLVAWLDIPANVNEAAFMERLKRFPEATIYKVVDNEPVLTDNQEYAISQGLRTRDDYANSQIVRHGSDDADGKWSAGDIVLDDLGRPVYKQTFFTSTHKNDIDRRDNIATHFYASPELKNEMAGVNVFSVEQGI